MKNSVSDTDRIVFITGMIRSGSTLLTRMLDAYPRSAIASDPYLPIFKAIRNTVAEQITGANNIDYNLPLEDYYFYPEKQKIMEGIQGASLDLPIGNLQLSELRQQIAKAAYLSQKIVPFLDDLRGDTYSDLIISGLNIIKKAYGDEETQMIGFKSGWTDEFAKHILLRLPNAKVIHIIRDPRAVAASIFSTGVKYPFVFVSRQWRKLATFAWVNSQPSSCYSNRVFVVKYEDLVTNPLRVAKELCAFLEIEFSERMVDFKFFKDGVGNSWRQNTFYYQGIQGFSQKSIERWKGIFTSDQIGLIESLCFGEMLLYGYKSCFLKDWELPLSLVFNPPEVDECELTEWIKPYSALKIEERIHDMALECIRSTALTNGRVVSDDEKRQLCLNKDFFDFMKQRLLGI